MPVVSQAQNRWAHWAEKNASGSERAAAADFVNASHGMKVSKLPQRVHNGKPVRGRMSKPKHREPPAFGALYPED